KAKNDSANIIFYVKMITILSFFRIFICLKEFYVYHLINITAFSCLGLAVLAKPHGLKVTSKMLYILIYLIFHCINRSLPIQIAWTTLFLLDTKTGSS